MPQEDPVSGFLKNVRDEIMGHGSLKRSVTLVNVHFLWGEPEKPGAIRRSSIWLKPETNRRISREDVFQEHVRNYERKNIFISIVESWAGKHTRQSVVHSLDLMIRAGQVAPVRIQESTRGLRTTARVWVTQSLVDDLCPQKLIARQRKRLLGALALRPPASQEARSLFDKGFRDELGYRQSMSLGLVHSHPESFKAVCTFAARDRAVGLDFAEEADIVSRFLGGLQLAYLYFRLSHPNGDLSGRVAKFVVQHRLADKPTEPTAMTMAVVFPWQGRPEDETVIASDLNSALQDILKDLSQRKSQTVFVVPPTFADLKNRVSNCDEGIEKAVAELFALGIQSTVTKLLVRGVMRLAEELRESVHEGEPLDFAFVVGDRTQFLDSAWVTFRTFQERDWKRLIIPTREGAEAPERIEQQLRGVAEVLRGEHFPWFQRGRYALFWDVTDTAVTDLRPFGLATLVGSSWTQYFIQHETGSHSIPLPASFVLHVRGERREADLLIQRTERPVERLATCRDRTGWRLFRNDARRIALKEFLTQRMHMAENWTDTLVEVVLRLAEDPLHGGTLVVLNERGSLGDFLQMGQPWDFKEDSRDIQALMSHDGATVLKLEGGEPKFQHRSLLMPRELADDIWCGLRSVSSREAQNVLTGGGSRRWSAAVTAFSDKVDQVIVISQDGDIVCWSMVDTERKTAKITRLRRDGGQPEEEELSLATG